MNSAKLVAVTKPLVEGLNTAEELISYLARVSNPSNQMELDTAPRLLNYCYRKSHFSVFDMADLTMELNTTRDIGRQALRHWTFRFQEFSQRYAEVDCDFVIRECRLQDPKNRQNSIEIDIFNEEHVRLRDEWDRQQRRVAAAAEGAYKWAIRNGLAKEQARVVLPEGMTPTTFYMKGSLRSWITYTTLRIANGTQKEHSLIAKDCFKIVCEQFPAIKDILSK